MTSQLQRTLRTVDVSSADAAPLSDAISALYDNTLDLVVVRQALPPTPLAAAAASLDRDERDPGWDRPNAQVPPEDIQVLGTAATPTYSTPRGPSLDAYLDNASWYQRAPLFDASFDPTAEITKALARFSGGRPVEVLHATDRRRFAPFTVRRLTEGKGIGLHHDLHMSLAMFRDLSPHLDTRTLISYVVTLQGPDAGGELFVYDLSPDAPNPPKLANGFSWDLPAVEARCASAKVSTQSGDIFLFASARCLHRVAPTVGPKARITMGGFLALDRNQTRVLYWS